MPPCCGQQGGYACMRVHCVCVFVSLRLCVFVSVCLSVSVCVCLCLASSRKRQRSSDLQNSNPRHINMERYSHFWVFDSFGNRRAEAGSAAKYRLKPMDQAAGHQYLSSTAWQTGNLPAVHKRACSKPLRMSLAFLGLGGRGGGGGKR